MSKVIKIGIYRKDIPPGEIFDKDNFNKIYETVDGNINNIMEEILGIIDMDDTVLIKFFIGVFTWNKTGMIEPIKHLTIEGYMNMTTLQGNMYLGVYLHPDKFTNMIIRNMVFGASPEQQQNKIIRAEYDNGFTICLANRDRDTFLYDGVFAVGFESTQQRLGDLYLDRLINSYFFNNRSIAKYRNNCIIMSESYSNSSPCELSTNNININQKSITDINNSHILFTNNNRILDGKSSPNIITYEKYRTDYKDSFISNNIFDVYKVDNNTDYSPTYIYCDTVYDDGEHSHIPSLINNVFINNQPSPIRFDIKSNKSGDVKGFMITNNTVHARTFKTQNHIVEENGKVNYGTVPNHFIVTSNKTNRSKVTFDNTIDIKLGDTKGISKDNDFYNNYDGYKKLIE